MRIVILDGYTENPGDLSWDGLGELGDLTVYDRSSLTDESEIIARIGDAEAVFTNKSPITAAVIDSCPSLKFIGALSTGYNVVDYVHARKRGIPVTNVPGYGTAAVGQYAIALLLEICHHIGHHDRTVHEGAWERAIDWCYWDYPLIELSGKTLGIIGFGSIGQTVGRIAHAMGMKILACASSNAGRTSDFAEYFPLDRIFAESDVITLHCTLFPETAGLINRDTIGKMKDGVILINNSRGGLIVERDLADALNSGKVAAAAVDVVSFEPIRGDNPLLHAKNCIITPHISWASRECRQRIIDCAIANLKAFLEGTPIHVVN